MKLNTFSSWSEAHRAAASLVRMAVHLHRSLKAYPPHIGIVAPDFRGLAREALAQCARFPKLPLP